jgi:hypothetical protein
MIGWTEGPGPARSGPVAHILIVGPRLDAIADCEPLRRLRLA